MHPPPLLFILSQKKIKKMMDGKERNKQSYFLYAALTKIEMEILNPPSDYIHFRTCSLYRKILHTTFRIHSYEVHKGHEGIVLARITLIRHFSFNVHPTSFIAFIKLPDYPDNTQNWVEYSLHLRRTGS